MMAKTIKHAFLIFIIFSCFSNLKGEENQSSFSFAESCKKHKKFEEAIKCYKDCLEKEGFKEEIWLSKCRIGECYEGLGRGEEALHWYLEAFQNAPTRIEPLRNIANFYRKEGKYSLAYLFAKLGHPLSAQSPYDYQLDEIIALVAYHTPFKEEGFVASNTLLLQKNVPGSIKEQAYKNMLFYVPKLKDALFQPITFERPRIEEGSTSLYNPMNASIQKTDGGYSVICRTVNYVHSGWQCRSLETNDPTNTLRSKNYLLTYDRDFKMLSQNEVIENLPRDRIHLLTFEGLEDCRLFDFNRDFWFTCTTSDTSPYGNPQTSLCKLSKDTSAGVIKVDKLIPLKGPDPHRWEKNWLPIVRNDELFLIYSYSPFTLYKPDVETGECKKELSFEPKYDFSRFRGSASPIEFDGGYLMLIHEVIYNHQNLRFDLHRFLYLDKNLQIEKISKPFIFKEKGIEFCCGMTLDHEGTKLVMTISSNDREAFLCFTDIEIIRSMLELY